MKTMIHPVVAACAAVVSLCAFGAGDVLTCDFVTEKLPDAVQIKRAKVQNGYLLMNMGATLNVKFAEGVAAPCEITYRLRVIDRQQGKAGAAFMLQPTGGEAASALFSLRDAKQVESYFYSHGKKTGGPAIKAKPAHEDGVWHVAKLQIGRKFATFFVDGVECVSGAHTGIDPLTGFTLSAYCVAVELDDLRVSTYDETKPQIVERPTVDLKGLVPAGTYAATNAVSSKVGGVMFWMRGTPKGGQAFRLKKGQKTVLSACTANNNGPRAIINVARTDTPKKTIEFTRNYFGVLGDWVLVTLTWNEFGETRYFINTLPVVDTLSIFGQRMPELVNPDLDGVTELVVGSSDPKQPAAEVRNLRIFHRTVGNREVCDEYRRVMPYDVVMNESIVNQDRPASVTLTFAPGGSLTLPAPVAPLGKTGGTDEVTFTVLDGAGREMASEKRTVTVKDAEVDVSLKPLVYSNGNYSVRVDVGGRYRRTFAFAAFTSDYRPAFSEKDVEKYELLYERVIGADDRDLLAQGVPSARTLDGLGYVEAGGDVTDRISWEIPFPAKTSGQPVLLEIDWPDDKARLMGLYLYKPEFACRDYLQQGISSGHEIPLSGKMQTQSFLFYPTYTNWLFEARTLAPKMPAAIRAVRVYSVKGGRLPANPLILPKGMEGRHFGFFDEDQTFHNNLNAGGMNPKLPCGAKFRAKYPIDMAFQNDEYYKYFDYIGMDSVTEPVWRYHTSMIPGDGKILGGLWPCASLGWVWKEFAAHNQRFIASMNFCALPELYDVERFDAPYLKEGLSILDKDGDPMGDAFMGKYPMSPCHPKCAELLLAHIRPAVARYAKAGLRAIQWDVNLGTWYSLTRGYDDYATGLFAKETGIAVPAELRKRYAYLTGEKREAWLAWRAQKVTALVTAMRKMLDEIDPTFGLQLVVPRDAQRSYVEQGLDLAALKRIPHISFCVNRDPTMYRHDMHWSKEESTRNEDLYDFAKANAAAFATDGKPPAVRSYYAYFETFVKSLKNNPYGSYFENADVKSRGRFYLREPAFALAAFDTCEYLAGAQPLPSVGHEAESREFARAFRALPARAFRDVTGIRDPVVARYLPTENGTYFYLVNVFHEDITVKMDVGGFWSGLFGSYVNLSTGAKESGGTFTLKGFEAKSYLVPDETVEVKNLRFVGTTDAAARFYAARIAELEATADELEKAKLEVADERRDLATLKDLLKADRWAELYRVAFSRRMCRLAESRANIANMLVEQTMRKTGAWRINCGGNGYVKTTDGRVFAPDRKFEDVCGYEGFHNSTTRDVTGMKPSAEAELYKTEAYQLGRYRFKVPEGSYTVKVYMKCGWLRGFVDGHQRFSLQANGRDFVAGGMDLFKLQNRDFHQPYVATLTGVAPEKGEIAIEWTPSSYPDRTEPLANAIEIIPEK